MKAVKVFSTHPFIKDKRTFVDHYRLDPLCDKFSFEWCDAQHAEYIFFSEHIYVNKKAYNTFKQVWENGRKSNRIFIAFFEEAQKPDMNLFDYALCYDADFRLGDRITRVYPVHTFMRGFVIDNARPARNLEEAREMLQSKEKFCNFMYSYSYKERDDLFRVISRYKHVDSLGRVFHNTDFVPTGFINHAKETTELRRPYKFTIAAENGVYNGYTSEKLMTALQANTVPIYFGNPRINEDFNEEAFINVSNYKTYEDLINTIKKIDEDDDLWCEIICKPWQTEEQILREEERLREYYAFFERIFQQSVKEAKRLEQCSRMDIYQKWYWSTKPKEMTVYDRIKYHLFENK